MWWTLAIVATLMLTVGANQEIHKHKAWLNSTEANKKIKAVIKQKKLNIATVLNPQDEDVSKMTKDCKLIAKLKCGCHYIASFEKSIKEPHHRLTFSNRCKFRTSMFECLSNVTNTSYTECPHLNVKLLKTKYVYYTHMKEIVKVLSKNRDCLVGPEALPQTSKKEKALKVKSSFCAKLDIKPKKSAGSNSKQNKPKKTKKVAKKS